MKQNPKISILIFYRAFGTEVPDKKTPKTIAVFYLPLMDGIIGYLSYREHAKKQISSCSFPVCFIIHKTGTILKKQG
jgi:hypothetical protein